MRFLRARKFEQDRALSLYIHYYENKRDYPAIFSEFTPQSVVEILKCGAINVLDGRMNNGTKVWVCVSSGGMSLSPFTGYLYSSYEMGYGQISSRTNAS